MQMSSLENRHLRPRSAITRPLGFAVCAAISLLVLPASAQRAGDPSDLTLDLNGTPLILKHIPKGSFQQGSPPSEPGRGDDETQRQVTLSKDFYLGQFPVTRDQFQRFIDDTGHRTEAEKGKSGGFGWDGNQLVQKPEYNWKNPGFTQAGDHPVVIITVGDAQAFLDWASRKAGRRLRLPTEAEYEYAARANTQTPWYSGANDSNAYQIGWFKSNTEAKGTQPAGKKQPNLFGLYDMSGNVYEWCSDIYAPYAGNNVTDPFNLTPPAGEPARNVLRGGSFLKEAHKGRSAARYRNTPGSRNPDNGFRVASDIDALLPAGQPFTSSPSTPSGTSTPSTTTSSPRATDIILGLLIILVFPLAIVGIIIFFFVKLIRKSMGKGKPQAGNWSGGAWSNAVATPPGIRCEATRDGFWIYASGYPNGTRVSYSCMVAGQRYQQEAVINSSHVFAYTGGFPSNIRIHNVVRPGQGWSPSAGSNRSRKRKGGWSNQDYYDNDYEPSNYNSSSSSSFFGNPRAY